MEISKIENGSSTVFALNGRLDSNTAPKLQEVLLPELKTAKNVTLDFAGLSYVSSAGLRVLLMGEKAAKANASGQTLVNVSPEIMDIFEITGFSAILKIG